MDEKKVARARMLLAQEGWNMRRVAAKLKVSYSSVYRATGGKKALLKANKRKAKRK
jgi:AcrR family transcriptional regulator